MPKDAKNNQATSSNTPLQRMPMSSNEPFGKSNKGDEQYQHKVPHKFSNSKLKQQTSWKSVPKAPVQPLLRPMNSSESNTPTPVNPFIGPVSVQTTSEVSRPNNNPFSPNILDKTHKDIAKELLTHKASFLSWNSENQKTFLRSIMRLRLKNFKQDQRRVPKIIDLLSDLDILDFDEIVEIIENDDRLQERIEEATEVLATGLN